MIRFINIDQIIIKIYNNKNILFFCKNLVNITLKTGQNIRQTKWHNLIFEINMLSMKQYFLFGFFLNLYLIKCTC